MISAFIKKLARLSLTANPHGCIIALICIYRLLQHHSGCRKLIHNPPKATPQEVLLIGSSNNFEETSKTKLTECSGYDPFLPDEKDLKKCNATQSSLWELQTLAEHYNPIVSRLVKIFESDFSKVYLLDDFLEESYQSLFDGALKRRTQGTVPLQFNSETKKRLFFPEEEQQFEMWEGM